MIFLLSEASQPNCEAHERFDAIESQRKRQSKTDRAGKPHGTVKDEAKQTERENRTAQ